MTKEEKGKEFQSSFELTGYITGIGFCKTEFVKGFKALSSLQVI